MQVAQERSRKARHGRVETRTLWTLTSADLNASVGSAGTVGMPWPGVAQVLRLQRVVQRTDRATGRVRTHTEVVYAITSVPPERATAADLLLRWRTHWHIEIVQTQITKPRVLAPRASGDHVADLDLGVGDHNPIDEQFDQLPPLLERRTG